MPLEPRRGAPADQIAADQQHDGNANGCQQIEPEADADRHATAEQRAIVSKGVKLAALAARIDRLG